MPNPDMKWINELYRTLLDSLLRDARADTDFQRFLANLLTQRVKL